MDNHTSYKWQFIGSLLVVSIVAMIGFGFLSVSYHNRLDRIEEIQRNDCKQISQLLSSSNMNKWAITKENGKIADSFEKHEERMQSLLEMEFEKLQNDFNFISLWAGLITIVFLIFSIYSIFKTDEMLKKSEKVYEDIKTQSVVIDNFTKNIQRKYKSELKTLKKESDDFIKELTQKISMLNERLASIDSLIKKTREETQTDDTILASSEEQSTQEPQTES